MKRKFLSVLLAGMLTSGILAPAVYAEEEYTEDYTEEYTEDGDMYPETEMEDPDAMLVIDDGTYEEDYGDYDDGEYSEDGGYTDDGSADDGYTEDTYTEDTYTEDNYTGEDGSVTTGETGTSSASETTEQETQESVTDDPNRDYIERHLDLWNVDCEWKYYPDSDVWVLMPVPAVAHPEIEDQEGVSVAVPGAYVYGIDTDGDSVEDVRAGDEGSANGNLVINWESSITSTNGQTYTASSAPVIINTGAAGYSSQTNQEAPATYAKEGYINVTCGNRGKQSTAENSSGRTYYTGDAPLCLADQKSVVRFMKYNILLGNIPGSVDRFVSTGGSGGGAHAVMLAATSNHPDFYDYEHAVGAAGIYKNTDGSYVSSVNIFGDEVTITDGVWGCMAYSPITSLAEADMALAFEYTLDTDYEFSTPFQKMTAMYLARYYMDYINDQNLNIFEGDFGIDMNEDGDTEDFADLYIGYDEEAETFGGPYVDFYLAKFNAGLQKYLDNLSYAEGWTWFDESGSPLSDEAVSAMTSEDKAKAFIEGRYSSGNSGFGRGGFGGGRPGGMGMPGDGTFSGAEEMGGFGGERPDGMGMPGDGTFSGAEEMGGFGGGRPDGDGMPGDGGEMVVGTPDAGTTQASGSQVDSANYSSYAEMVQAYAEDIAEIQAGDRYGKNIADLYNPLRYIGADGTDNPTWVRMLMGATEGDISLFNSMNLELAFRRAGTDAVSEWQWNGGHVPSEILGDSFSLYVDEMYGKYTEGASEITKPEPSAQETNGTAEEADGTDISSLVNYDDISNVLLPLESAVSIRTNGASKAIPAFDVIDYGQEDYVFGSTRKDARHWSLYVWNVFENHSDELSALFNGGAE